MTFGALRNQPIIVLWPDNPFKPPEWASYVVFPSSERVWPEPLSKVG
jgi:hypothetical protein